MKFLTLEEWCKKTYSSNYPTLQTLQRWARGGYIYPAPEKHGRAYRVREDAIYINPRTFSLKNHTTRVKPLIEKIISETAKLNRQKYY
ncbi:excisionase [Rouxiella badensis]|uniref:excisionase n=1 Tax=Rouxiella badensis TaxID=1646377 RepID=UPI00301D2455